MKFTKTLLASAALVASFGASADVVGSLGGGAGSFLALSGPPSTTAMTVPCTNATCTLGGTLGTISGGALYVSDQPFADIPAGAVFNNTFLAAGPTATEPSTISFGGGTVNYISFLWGSPDLYNVLTVTTGGVNGTSQVFSAGAGGSGVTGLNFAVTDGNQGFSQYVQFAAEAGSFITSLTFTNNPSINAFEVANFTVTPVPEPETYALMLAGLGALGFIARRRKRV